MAFNTVVPEDPWTQANRLGQYRTGVLQQYPAGPVIQQHLAGQIPADVLSQLYQRGAEAGISRGMPGSDATNAATMRALGLTSYGIQSQGLEELANLYRLPGAPPPEGTKLWTPGLQNTGAPLGGPAPAGGAPGGGAGGTVKPTAPAGPPGGGYDTWLEDWMKRAGAGATTGSLPTMAPSGAGSLRTFGPAGGGDIIMGATPEGTSNFPGSSAYDPFGTLVQFGIEKPVDFDEADWWQQFMDLGDLQAAAAGGGGPSEGIAPEGTVPGAEADFYSPFPQYQY